MKAKTTAELNARYGFFPFSSEISTEKSAKEGTHAPFTELSSLRRPFATTAEFSSMARNHCCAVMTVNLLLQKFPAYCAGFSRKELFSAVHAFVGNGPVLTLRGANRFLQNAGLAGRFVRIPAASLFSRDLSSSEQPGYYALLLAASSLDWHWILAFSLPSGIHNGLPVLTGWDSSRLHLWKPEHGSRLLSVWKFQA